MFEFLISLGEILMLLQIPCMYFKHFAPWMQHKNDPGPVQYEFSDCFPSSWPCLCFFLLLLVLAAEIVRYQIPKLVDMHNYNAASSVENKITNWTLLNRY